MNRRGCLVVISGPSGVGKGTIAARLLKADRNLVFSVSATTRAMRPGEKEGVHYFFKTREEFERMIDADAFLEYMCVFGSNYYGTPRAAVEEKLAAGYDVLLDIDVQGAMRVMETCPDAVSVFIAPPSLSELKARLTGRGTETPEAIEKRFRTAEQEIALLDKYDYVVINDSLEEAVTAVQGILAAEHRRTKRNLTIKDQILGRL